MYQLTKLKPALVLGSGFHQHVLGETSNKQAQPLHSWNELITQVAERLQVAVPSTALTPIHRWESLVLRAVSDGYRSIKGGWLPLF